jgi:hypothetical protein
MITIAMTITWQRHHAIRSRPGLGRVIPAATTSTEASAAKQTAVPPRKAIVGVCSFVEGSAKISAFLKEPAIENLSLSTNEDAGKYAILGGKCRETVSSHWYKIKYGVQPFAKNPSRNK